MYLSVKRHRHLVFGWTSLETTLVTVPPFGLGINYLTTSEAHRFRLSIFEVPLSQLPGSVKTLKILEMVKKDHIYPLYKEARSRPSLLFLGKALCSLVKQKELFKAGVLFENGLGLNDLKPVSD